MALTLDSVVGRIIAPPTPWTARAVIRADAPSAAAAARLPRAKTTRPADEHGPAPDPIREPAEGQQQRSEDHRVQAVDPLGVLQ
jgi:hypothetical protein